MNLIVATVATECSSVNVSPSKNLRLRLHTDTFSSSSRDEHNSTCFIQIKEDKSESHKSARYVTHRGNQNRSRCEVFFNWRTSSGARLGAFPYGLQSGPLFALLHTHLLVALRLLRYSCYAVFVVIRVLFF